MDPTIQLRRLAYEESVDPRTILIPRVSDVDTPAERTRAIDQFALDNLYTTYTTLATDYVNETEGPPTGEYMTGALEQLAEYVNFYNTEDLFLLYLSEAMLAYYTGAEIAASLDAIRQTSIIRTRTTPQQLDSELASMRKQREQIVRSTAEYYENRIEPIERQLASVVPVPVLDSSSVYARTEATVTLDESPITQDSFSSVMSRLLLTPRLYYATRRVDNDNRRLVLADSRQDLSSLPTATRDDEMLLLVATPGQRDRTVTISGSYSTISVMDAGDLDLVLAALPGLDITSRVDTALSSAITVEYTPLYPTVMYYFIQNYAPWLSLMGVDDVNYKKKGIRTITVRYNRWPIPGIDELGREKTVNVQVALSRVVREGRPVQAIVFSTKEGTLAEATRVNDVLMRFIGAYSVAVPTILKLYRSTWPKNVAEELLEQMSLGAIRAGRELALLRPDIFGGEYQRTCDKKPVLTDPDDEDATEVPATEEGAPIYIKCSDARTELDFRPRLDDPNVLVPCCVPTSKRAVINQRTAMTEGQRGYLFGAARLFGVPEPQKKGVTPVARVGAQRSLTSVLIVAMGKDKTLSAALDRVLDGEVNVAPFKQCMWDYTDDQIREYLADGRWDSDLVLDGVALNCRVNIFVIEYNEDKMTLRVPRYKFAYYIPFYIDRPSVFIYRYETQSTVIYENVALDSKTSYEFVYKRTVTDRAIAIFQSQHITELIDRNGNYSKMQDRGPYTTATTPTDVTQIIDAYGKMRGYVDQGVAKYYDTPSAPLLLPYTATPPKNTTVTLTAQHTEVRWRNIPLGERLISLPTDIQEGNMSIPITWDEDRVRQYLLLNRQRQHILQLSNWLWSNTVNGLRAAGDTDPVDLSPLFVVDEVDYQFDILPPELGEYEVSDAMEYLRNTGFTRPDTMQVIVPSEGVREGVIQMLNVAEETRANDADIPTRLVGLEVDRESARVEGTLLRSVYLKSDVSYSRWSASERAFSEASVMDLSNPNIRTYPYPFTVVSISKTKGQERWIVQNVQNGSYQRALQCCARWVRRNDGTVFNSGFTTEMIADADRALKYTVVYSWNESGLLTPDVEHTGNHLSLLVYPGYKRMGDNITGHFAALLPLTSS